MSNRPLQPASAPEPGVPQGDAAILDGSSAVPAPEGPVTERDAAIIPELIPATAFAALVGRTLRTLRNWDRDGITNPVIINRRRYYRRTDIVALLANGSDRTGPREGSRVKYFSPNTDDGT